MLVVETVYRILIQITPNMSIHEDSVVSCSLHCMYDDRFSMAWRSMQYRS